MELEGCEASEPYALQVTDDSMEPEFPKDCIIIIEPVKDCRHGQYVVAECDDVRWFRQYIIKDDHKYLIALKDPYPDIELKGNYRIIGNIIQRNVKRKVKHYPA